MAPADVLRVICVVLALLLVPSCVYCTYRCTTWSQRLRFAALALMGVVIVAWQIEMWGYPLRWWVVLLLVALLSALVGTAVFLREMRRGLED
jgi:hypothetical protein